LTEAVLASVLLVLVDPLPLPYDVAGS